MPAFQPVADWLLVCSSPSPRRRSLGVRGPLTGTDAVYVALDLDVLDPSEVDVLIPEPDGPSADEIDALLRDVAGEARIAGIGVTGYLATERNAALAARMLAAAGF